MNMTATGRERLWQVLHDAQDVIAWLEHRHPGSMPLLHLTWCFHIERIRHLTILGDRGNPNPLMSAQAVEAMAALGWTRTRSRGGMPFLLSSSEDLSHHQRLMAVARINRVLGC